MVHLFLLMLFLARKGSERKLTSQSERR